MNNADMPAMPFCPTQDRHEKTPGITKREYFSAKALPRIESVGDAGDDAECARRAARMAVMLADALLTELERTGGGS